MRLPLARAVPPVLAVCLLAGCSSLLPRSEETTVGAWASYAEAQAAFDRIRPGETTAAELRSLDLDPATNPNIVILNYTDVLRRFIVSQSISLEDLDRGVRECVLAKTLCRGYEIDQKQVARQRKGNLVLDVLGFRRETHVAGWRFQGLVLLNDGRVVYKLTGGQPTIASQENTSNPLGPVQSVAGKLIGWSPN